MVLVCRSCLVLQPQEQGISGGGSIDGCAKCENFDSPPSLDISSREFLSYLVFLFDDDGLFSWKKKPTLCPLVQPPFPTPVQQEIVAYIHLIGQRMR